MIVGSFYPILYYAFYCDPWQYRVHLFMITALGLGTLKFILAPGFQLPKNRKRRTMMFVVFGMYGILPMGTFLARPESRNEFGSAVLLVVVEVSLYLGGAAMFATTTPEKQYPGKFDWFQNSHQIWHCCVLSASIAHFYAVCEAYRVSISMHVSMQDSRSC